MRLAHKPFIWTIALFLVSIVACSVQRPLDGARHRWWSGLGPVLPHDSFPADCSLCHQGQTWNSLRADFSFDHEKETGVPLPGAHEQAQCLRCHNDRGPVVTFAQAGCVGCHEDVHQGRLSRDCTSCHDQETWFPSGMVARHNRTRLPLTGAHASVPCSRCHEGAFVGRFHNADTECLSCHQLDLQAAINPPHIGLGWVDNCNECHIPTVWSQARIR